MRAKHTPGPWTVRDIPTQSIYIGPSNDGAAPSVAVVMARVNASDERMMADARLIASAPELLAALQKAAGALDLYHAYGWPDRAGVRNEIASVVAKATGENV